MRTPKKIYIIKEEKTLVGYDRLDRPVYEIKETYIPVKCDIEPFGRELSEKSYGVFIEATHRVFSKPNDLLKLNKKVKYNGDIYKIVKVVKYDKHYETLLK